MEPIIIHNDVMVNKTLTNPVITNKTTGTLEVEHKPSWDWQQQHHNDAGSDGAESMAWLDGGWMEVVSLDGDWTGNGHFPPVQGPVQLSPCSGAHPRGKIGFLQPIVGVPQI